MMSKAKRNFKDILKITYVFGALIYSTKNNQQFNEEIQYAGL